jgi:hypothetical protein
VLRRIAQAGLSGLSGMVNGTAPPDAAPLQSAPGLRGPAVASADQLGPASETFSGSALGYSDR